MSEILQALSYYRKELKKSEAAINYLKERGLTAQTVNEFKLGFAPAQPTCFQMFRNRIMCPVQDTQGEYVAFVGRTIVGEEPKYKNSWESEVYQKGRILFGFVKAFSHILEKDEVILVEGQFDVFQLWQTGIKNVIAGSGTGFTPIQARLLSRYARKVFVVFDSDGAGEKAFVRVNTYLTNVGVEVVKGILPKGYDPDDYVKEFGAEKFLECINEGKNG